MMRSSPSFRMGGVGMLLMLMLMMLWCDQTQCLTTEPTDTTDEIPDSAETRLQHMLLSRYAHRGVHTRPVVNASEAVLVRYGMRLMHVTLDERSQTLQTSVWIRQQWEDKYLTWKPEDHGGIKHIAIPHDKVWTPDVVVVNTPKVKEEGRLKDLSLRHDGWLLWYPHHEFRTGCLLDLTRFPYDSHTCDIWVQSMTWTSKQLDLREYHKSPWNLDTYTTAYEKANQWEIIGNSTEQYNQSRTDGVTLKYSRRTSLRFSLTLKRRFGYITFVLMFPCLLLGALDIMVFALPIERPDRNALGTSLFSSLFMLLLILVGVAPPSAASVPLLCYYYGYNMIAVMLSVMLSALVGCVNNMGNHGKPVPQCLQHVFVRILSWPLCLRTKAQAVFDDTAQEDNASTEMAKKKLDPETPHSPAFNNIKQQWNFISLCLDRIFLCLYLVGFVVSVATLFPR